MTLGHLVKEIWPSQGVSFIGVKGQGPGFFIVLCSILTAIHKGYLQQKGQQESLIYNITLRFLFHFIHYK